MILCLIFSVCFTTLPKDILSLDGLTETERVSNMVSKEWKLELLKPKGSKRRTDGEKINMLRVIVIFKHHPHNLSKTAAIDKVINFWKVGKQYLRNLYDHWVLTGELLQAPIKEKESIDVDTFKKRTSARIDLGFTGSINDIESPRRSLKSE